MKKSLLTLVMLMLLLPVTQAQTQKWIKQLDYRAPYAVTTYRNLIVVAGTEDYPGPKNIAQGFVTVYDNDGQILSDKSFGSPMADRFRALACSNGNVFLTGTSWEKNKGNQLWFVKTDLSGNVLFDKKLGGKYDDFGQDIILTKDNNVLITGSTKASDNDLLNLWVIKADTNGNIIWEKNYGSLDYGEEGLKIKELENGYLIIAKKWLKKGLADFDTWLVMLDKQNGNILWTRELADVEDNIVKDAVDLPNNALMFIGHNDNKLKTHKSDLWIVIMNSQGRTMASKTAGSRVQERGLRIFKHGSKYLIAGNIDEKAAFWLTDANANIQNPVSGLADIMHDAALKDNKLILVGGNNPGYVKVIEVRK